MGRRGSDKKSPKHTLAPSEGIENASAEKFKLAATEHEQQSQRHWWMLRGPLLVLSIGLIVSFFSNSKASESTAPMNGDTQPSVHKQQPAIDVANEPVIFGFLPDYRFDSSDLEFMTSRVTHLCFFGSEADPHTGGTIIRLPSKEKLAQIRKVAHKTGTKLLISFGGAGRSDFFTIVLNDRKKYGRFHKELTELLQREALDGVELNWMYPTTTRDIASLQTLVHDLKKATLGLMVTMAIPPDKNFAKAIKHIDFDLLHVMMYQAGVARPDSLRFARDTMRSIQGEVGTGTRLTLGVPFYGTNKASGESISYEEVFTKRDGSMHALQIEDGKHLKAKRALVMELGWKGLSIWELGQDCRPREVGPHVRTCPNGESDTVLMSLQK